MANVNPAAYGRRAVWVLGALFVLVVAFSSYYTIDQGSRGVVLHYGKVVGVSDPGLHFKMPFVTSIEPVSVQIQKDSFEQHGSDDFRMEAYTQDQQPTHVALAINYHVTDPAEVYAEYGSLDNLQSRRIDPCAYEQLKNIMGQFDAISAIQKRAALDAGVGGAIRHACTGPFAVDAVQVEDIAFSEAYEQAVEQRMQAIVAQEQAVAEKQRRITNADAAAYEVKAAADAKAHQVEVEGEAEGDAIRKRGEALKENPEMPQLVAAEKWDGHLPATMPPNASVPFLSLQNH